jgi:hypothetical protein
MRIVILSFLIVGSRLDGAGTRESGVVATVINHGRYTASLSPSPS